MKRGGKNTPQPKRKCRRKLRVCKDGRNESIKYVNSEHPCPKYIKQKFQHYKEKLTNPVGDF